MAEILNLRMARKRKARAERGMQAAANRALHGRAKAEKQRQDAIAKKDRAFVEGHRRDKPASPK